MTRRILISDKMSADGLNHFKGHEGFEVVYEPEITMEQLAESIGEFDALVIRSRTTVKRETLANPGKLKIIGRAGAGVDNVDVNAATERGIIVMNTPGGNTLSTAEHTIAMMLSLARQIPAAHQTMKEGQWDKKSFMGVELHGKTLGILGLGKIGAEVASRMQAFGMNVLGFDPFQRREMAEKMKIQLADVDEICRRADILTVHCPLNDQTRGLINAERLATMKKTALIVNCARGGIIDEAALYEALSAGKIAGAAIDVFVKEPLPGDDKLRTLKNVVLTPHLAASTTEAQEKVAADIAVQIREALEDDVIRNAVNIVTVDSETTRQMLPLLDLAQRMGKFCLQYCKPTVVRIQLEYSGRMTEHPSAPMTTAFVQGFLSGQVGDHVNVVNAMYLAAQRGIKISEERTGESREYQGLFTVRTTNDSGEENVIAGTLYQHKFPRLVLVNEKRLDVNPEGEMLVLEIDVPGIIGSIGTLLAKHQVNIAGMFCGRTEPGGIALSVFAVDGPTPPEVIEAITKLPNIVNARRIVI